MNNRPNITSRRRVLKGAALSAAGTPFGILGSTRGQEAKKKYPIVGSGDHTYEVIHNWAQLPDKYSWQTTHNVAIDNNQNLYVIHEGRANLTDHPSIFVFDANGKFVKAFGHQFQGGGHGIEVHTEGREQFLYVCGFQQVKSFAKMTLDGEVVWEQRAPMDSGKYHKDEAENPQKVWGRNRFMPTNFAFLPDGGFLLADGYGAWTVHRYDKDANYVSSFGSEGKTDGKFRLPHGIWIDDRPGREPSVVVCDRSNARVQWLTLEGQHIKTMTDFILPANVDRWGEMLLIPDLSARITLVDKNDNLIHLAEDNAWRDKVLAKNKRMRSTPDGWENGRFVHPHDACFDAEGNIFVAEWVATGRITKMRKV